MTPGQWLAKIKASAEKITGANRAARHVWHAMGVLDGPAVVTITLTDAGGVPILADGSHAGGVATRGGSQQNAAPQNDATGWQGQWPS
eukprot:7119991-Prymnesium_polylepis.1